MKEEERFERIETALVEIKQLLNLIIGGRAVKAMEEPAGYLNVKQAAVLLGVEPSTIYLKCHAGNLPHTRIGKYYRFNKNELIRWMGNPEITVVDIDQYVDKYLQKNLFRG